MLALLAAALALEASPPPASPEPAGALTRAQSRLISERLAPYSGGTGSQTPALAVAIVTGGRIAYERGFGQANVTTRFKVASITKTITAVAVMQLVEAHRIDLDATVATYLPTAPYASRITVRQLLNHTSGLWNYLDAAVASGIAFHPTTTQQIFASIAAHPLAPAPGTTFAYSNSGYLLLGAIVERVSGQSLAAYDREHIFLPAKMMSSTFGTPTRDVSTATGYYTSAGLTADVIDPSWLGGAGDVVSTAGDLARFDIALTDGTLVGPQTFAMMQRDAVDAPFGHQALGLDLGSLLGHAYVGHHGGLPGFEAVDHLYLADGFAIVVLSDTSAFSTEAVERTVLTSLFPDAAESAATQPRAAAEDPAITARFRTALEALQRGDFDRSAYVASLGDSFTPAVLAQVRSLGPVATVTYEQTIPGTVYATTVYDVTFASGLRLRWIFALDAHGKIAALGSSG